MVGTHQLFAVEQGAGARPSGSRRKYQPTPETDAVIREAYRKQRMGDRSALKAAGKRLGWTRDAVCKRGAQLGIARIKERAWSSEEQEILERCGHLPPARVQRQLAAAGFSRSLAAIQVKLHRCRIKQNLDGYSACSLADAFGVDVHKVLAWIRRGLLRAQRRGTGRTSAQGGDMWWITSKDVRRFVLRAPEEVDLARVEKIWFLDLLTGGKLCA